MFMYGVCVCVCVQRNDTTKLVSIRSALNFVKSI